MVRAACFNYNYNVIQEGDDGGERMEASLERLLADMGGGGGGGDEGWEMEEDADLVDEPALQLDLQVRLPL